MYNAKATFQKLKIICFLTVYKIILIGSDQFILDLSGANSLQSGTDGLHTEVDPNLSGLLGPVFPISETNIQSGESGSRGSTNKFLSEVDLCPTLCDENRRIKAIAFYIKMKGTETILEKNKYNPIIDMTLTAKNCNLNELNKYIACIGQNGNIKIDEDSAEYCYLRTNIDKKKCTINTFDETDYNIDMMIKCLKERNVLKNNPMVLYNVLSVKDIYGKNKNNYNKNLGNIKKISCYVVKKYLEKNPKIKRPANLYDNLLLSEKMRFLMANFIKYTFIADQISCVLISYADSFSKQKYDDILYEECPEPKKYKSYSDNLLVDLFPINSSEKEDFSITVIIIIVAIVSVILIIYNSVICNKTIKIKRKLTDLQNKITD